jgi:hypothetical protein
LVCKLHGSTYKENHGFGIAEEAEWIEFQADGDPLDQGVQVQIPLKATTKSKVLCDGLLLSMILMITSLLMQGTSTFEAGEPGVTIKRCLCLCTSVGWFFSFTKEPPSLFLTF